MKTEARLEKVEAQVFDERKARLLPLPSGGYVRVALWHRGDRVSLSYFLHKRRITRERALQLLAGNPE